MTAHVLGTPVEPQADKTEKTYSSILAIGSDELENMRSSSDPDLSLSKPSKPCWNVKLSLVYGSMSASLLPFLLWLNNKYDGRKVSSARLPSSAAPAHDHAWTGRTERSLPRSSGGCPGTTSPAPGHSEHDPWLASAPRAQSMDLSEPTRTRRRSTTSSSRWWCGWRGRIRARDTGGSRASCSSSATASAPRQSVASSNATGFRSSRRRHSGGAERRQAGRQRASLNLSICLYLPLYPGLSRPHTAPRAIPRLPRGGAHPACLGHKVVDIA